MKQFYKLNKGNSYEFAVKIYDNPSCIDIDEFRSDYNRINCVRNLLKRWETNGETNLILLINHLVILSNVFSVMHSTRMLFLNIEDEYYSSLKTVIVWLDFLSSLNNKYISTHDGVDIDDIPLDNKLIEVLRNVRKNR